MSQLPYSPLTEANSTPRNSVMTVDSLNSIYYVGSEHPDYLCRTCKGKISKNQIAEHTPIECLSQRCEMLENETTKLKERDLKSRIYAKELENKLISLEEAIRGLTAPKQQQAAPFSFSSGQKLRNPFKKAQTVDLSAQESEINYDNILPPKRSNSRERVGLFGSLGAASQNR